MRIFAVGTKIFGGGPGQHLGGPVPPRPQRKTAPACRGTSAYNRFSTLLIADFTYFPIFRQVVVLAEDRVWALVFKL